VAGVLDKSMKAASHGRPVQLGNEDQVKKTYKSLEDLANQLAAFAGRRDIVWITDGIPSVYDPKLPKCKGFNMYSPNAPQTARNQASSDDPRNAGSGLDSRSASAIGSGGATGGDWIDCGLYVPHLGVTLEKNGTAVNPFSRSRDLSPDVNRDLEQMARFTGGHAYFNGDVRAALKQVARDAVNTYSIAYDPSAENWDNKFHKIQVTCERKGVRLQVRERYYALPDSRPAADRQKAVLVAAFQSRSDASEIGLRTKIAPAEGDKKGVHLEIRINPSDILLREQGGKFGGAIYFLVSDMGASGPLGEPSVSSFDLDLTSAQHDTVMKDGIPISQDHATGDAVERVRLIVLDQNTNAVGSLTFPVK